MKGKISLLLTISLCMVQADECDNKCTSSQACFPDGTCHERSDLVSCPSFTSINMRSYCKAGQECCGDGCMPEGKVCCEQSYCETGHTCCMFSICCPSGTYCSVFQCVKGVSSTRTPTTTTPRPSTKLQTTTTLPTTKLRTTLIPITRYPTRTYPSFSPSTNSSTYSRTRYSSEWTTKSVDGVTGKSSASNIESAFKPWHYAIIGIGVLFVIVVSAIVIRGHHNRKTTAKAQALPGRNGIVVFTPGQIYGHTNSGSGNNGSSSSGPTETNRPPQQINLAVITKLGTPSSTNGQQQNKRMVFVITKPNVHKTSDTKETNNTHTYTSKTNDKK